MASLDAEVAVVGAGPVGAVTALFAASGSRVVILDQAHFPRDKPCGEGLLPPGRAILARLGIEGAVREQRAKWQAVCRECPSLAPTQFDSLLEVPA